jgi:hypothetical protein
VAAPDRQVIQRIVERVFSERGIPRGASPGGSPSPGQAAEPKAKDNAETQSTQSGAEGVAAGLSPPTSGAASGDLKVAATPAAKKPEPPPLPIAAFVSEADVRRALTKGEKIYIGPKTIVTPAARDFGVEHEVLVETKGGS